MYRRKTGYIKQQSLDIVDKKKRNQYLIDKKIGEGACGKVYSVFDTAKNNQKYAMKVMKTRDIVTPD